MKNKFTKLFVAVILISGSAIGQENSNALPEYMRQVTNVEFLNKFSKDELEFSKRNYERAVEVAKQKNLPIAGVDEQGRYYEVISYSEEFDKLLYQETKNNQPSGSSISTIKVNYLHNNNIKGQGMLIGEWDGDVARSSHQAFNGRVQVRNTPGALVQDGDLHATHVAGTIIGNETAGGSGKVGEAKGMAPLATLASWNWTNDLSEMSSAAAQGLIVSNHSYGLRTDVMIDVLGVKMFGRYLGTRSKQNYGIQTSRDYDIIANNAPYYTIVFASGNDRDARPAFNSSFGGRDLLVSSGVSKNTIIVGAINGITNYVNSSSVSMSTFSNWGPTDDFRVKPDIVGKGVGVYSAAASNDNAYTTLQGTSMAAPSITGAIALWQQFYKEKTNKYMLSSTVRALMAHTALEAGNQIGPDFMYGWGVLNAEGGALVIDNLLEEKSVIEEYTLNNNSIYERGFLKESVSDLTATIAWNDPASDETSNNTANFFVKSLVNDLDIRLVNTDTNEEFLPYRLKNQWSAMQDGSCNELGDNEVDNIEKIFVPNAPVGNYKLIVRHKNSLTGGRQVFSLVLTGHEGKLSLVEEELSKVNIYPNPVVDYFIIDGNVDVLVGASYNLYDSTGRLVITNDIKSKDDLKINVNTITSGVYYLTLDKNGSYKTYKIIK